MQAMYDTQAYSDPLKKGQLWTALHCHLPIASPGLQGYLSTTYHITDLSVVFGFLTASAISAFSSPPFVGRFRPLVTDLVPMLTPAVVSSLLPSFVDSPPKSSTLTWAGCLSVIVRITCPVGQAHVLLADGWRGVSLGSVSVFSIARMLHSVDWLAGRGTRSELSMFVVSPSSDEGMSVSDNEIINKVV